MAENAAGGKALVERVDASLGNGIVVEREFVELGHARQEIDCCISYSCVGYV